jgi:hypothetical protein
VSKFPWWNPQIQKGIWKGGGSCRHGLGGPWSFVKQRFTALMITDADHVRYTRDPKPTDTPTRPRRLTILGRSS